MEYRSKSFTMTATTGFIALLVASASVSADVICSLNGYDTSSLMKQDYWFFNVHSQLSECIPGEDSSLCQIFFGVCNNLSSSLCGNSNSGACQKVTLKDKTIHKYSLGHPPEELMINNVTNGFFASYQNGANTTTCPSNITFTLSFVCNESHPWNVSNPDVTEHFFQYIVDGCQIVAEIYYSGACVKEEPDLPGCNSLGHYYKLFDLRSKDVWIAKVTSEYCAEVPASSSSSSSRALSTGGSTSNTCILFFSFCSDLPAAYCFNSTVCYRQPFFPISFGSFNKEFKVIENAKYSGFTIMSFGGSKTSECSDDLRSTLIFDCSKSANWKNKEDISEFTHPQARDPADPCNFVVRFDYNGACSSYTPHGSKSSVVGWVLIGIFFGVLVLYLCVGVAVQLARGKKGVELIPNYEQWKMFFILVLEGCQFSLDVITCFQCSRSAGFTKHGYDAL